MATKCTVQSLPDYAYAQLLTDKGIAIVADEPDDLGGNGLGPTPYQLLTWALGTCTAMTLQIYARRKGYPLLEVAVEVQHDRVHVEDTETTDEDPGGLVEQFQRKIVVRGPLTDEQRDDLLRVAGRCPVHKTLMAVPQVLDEIEVVE